MLDEFPDYIDAVGSPELSALWDEVMTPFRGRRENVPLDALQAAEEELRDDEDRLST